MNSQHLSKWNYKKLGKIVCAFLIILFHPQKMGGTLTENLAFINLYGITALGSQLHSTVHSKEQEFQNPCLHLVSGMTCSFSVPVVFFLLWKQGLRLWTSVPGSSQSRCHKIKSRLHEKCYVALNLVTKAKMQRYILKTLHLKGCPHQGPNWTQRFPKGKHISDWKPHPYQWSRIHYRGVSQLRHCGQGRKGG